VTFKLYCLGFLFGGGGSTVLLIRKQRPTWQSGLLNGVGGHIEADESPKDSMRREFMEEVNFNQQPDWSLFCVLSGIGFRMYVFSAFVPKIAGASAKTEEGVAVYYTRQLPPDTIPNLRWLIPMALSFKRGEQAEWFEVETISP
jgi:8-oxo-dGTP diphosphatase